MSIFNKKVVFAAALVCVFSLTGCGAMHTAIKKRNLEVNTQMSETIWLEPSSQRTVYLQVKNTSNKDMSSLQELISTDIRAKGYTVVAYPEKANYWIQANVLKADKMDLREANGLLGQGYQGAITGAALGSSIAAYNSNSAGTTLGVGLAAGVIGLAADTLVEDINYTMVTDVQITERTNGKVMTNDVAALTQGTSGYKIQTSAKEEHKQKYQTRVISNANKVNLKFEEAKPVLEKELANAISNIL
ncbi:conjugal transfer surface exclusion protein TraT [Plesiomonas shigelloides]|uniref:complement resistance protein TraT n=1 Tax=Plesiomonas shigelloides TaxID=703 RepID=UPI000E06CAB8|nr:complement resistance protein TraT [Plesiomonas shigelloides]SUB63806.1 conjugal transfer surface exclusion protein TraT [Plesiomonas shigelloides]